VLLKHRCVIGTRRQHKPYEDKEVGRSYLENSNEEDTSERASYDDHI
jgi:hypothetical protein